MPMEIAALILAAGFGRRFGSDPEQPKILAALGGKPLIRHVAEAAVASQARPGIVVLGPAAAKAQAALEGLDLLTLVNENPAAGLSHSLALGLAAVPQTCAGAVVLLADMPRISAEIIDRLIGAFHATPVPPRAVIPMRAGRRGNPVVLGRAIFAKAMGIEGDQGARGLFARDAEGVLFCPIDDEAIEIDVDTKESLAVLAGQSGREVGQD